MSKKPDTFIISRRSLLSPKPAVFLGGGDPTEKYRNQLSTMFVALLSACQESNASDKVKDLVTAEWLVEMSKASKAEVEKLNPVQAQITLFHLSNFHNLTLDGGDVRIIHQDGKNFASRRSVDYVTVITEFCQKHSDFFKAFWAISSPKPVEAVATPVEQEKVEENA